MDRDEYTVVLWARRPRESLVSDFVALANRLNLPEKDAPDQSIPVTTVKRWLEINPNRLLILDNADDLATVRESCLRQDTATFCSPLVCKQPEALPSVSKLKKWNQRKERCSSSTSR